MGETLFGTDGLSLNSTVLIAAAVVVCLLLVYWFFKRRGHMTFMRGGSNRQPRLAVLDAAAVDARRRLVLVRRDDTEHLILIGGPSDLVVESGINRTAPAAQPQNAKSAASHAQQRAVQPAGPPQPQKPSPEIDTSAVPPIQVVEAKPDPKPEQHAETPAAETKQSQPATVEAVADRRSVTRAEASPSKRPVSEPVADTSVPVAATSAIAASSATSKAVARDQEQSRKAAEPEASPEKEKPEPVTPLAMSEPIEDKAQLTPATKSESDIGDNLAVETPVEEHEALKTEFEDALDAARELVIPATTPAGEAPPAPEPDLNYAHAVPLPAKTIPQPAPQPTAPMASKPASEPQVAITKPEPPHQQTVSAEDLIADFDRVLEAEMKKATVEQLQPKATKPTEAKPVVPKPAEAKPSETAVSEEAGATLEDEMKKLLGDLTAKQ